MKKLAATMSLLGIVLMPVLPASAETGPCQEKRLRDKVACLNVRLGKLEELVKNLPKPTAPDLANVVRYGDKVQLRSNVFDNKCMDQRSNPNPGGNADFVLAHSCTGEPGRRWNINR